MERKIVAALACRNNGSRLYGKPIQNLSVNDGITILDNILDFLEGCEHIHEVVLCISEGEDNEVYKKIASNRNLKFIIGDEKDVLGRLIQGGEVTNATDIFRMTSESPFPFFQAIETIVNMHIEKELDATFLDDIIDGCGYELITLEALQRSHKHGEDKHRSELCSLFIRENLDQFKVHKYIAPSHLNRKDLRLTVDNPEDLILCRAIYENFKLDAPKIDVEKVVSYLDKNPDLKKLTAPFTELGYSTMYI